MTLSMFLVGEAWGREEALVRMPFVGKAGQELTEMLSDAGIDRADVLGISNVFNLRPMDNDLADLCFSRREAGKDYPFPSLSQGKYVRPEFFPHIFRLWDELREAKPNLIVPMGNTAMWATLGQTGIMSRRGYIATCKIPGLEHTKVLPTIHPAGILRHWDDRVLFVADLIKGRHECKFPEIRPTEREIWLDPTVDDLLVFQGRYISNFLSVDIETERRMVSCISLSPSPYISLVLPFLDRKALGYSYWKTPQEERYAWCWLRALMEDPSIYKLLQNGTYDIQYLWRCLHIKTLGYRFDSMIRHHSQQPELPKSLEFLGSVYTNERSWKGMRKDSKTTKREE